MAELGEGVTDFAPGEEVYGLIPFVRDGATAEYVTVPAAVLAAKPRSHDHEHTAALPLAGLTVWQGLVTHAGLTAAPSATSSTPRPPPATGPPPTSKRRPTPRPRRVQP
ncbi:hypothetical protein OG410_35945 [Streptomyces sp. NBC_00659]|uniref:hypothetical protein n=1 Tax=Streptomyces sp. NBC_00659 TaxID=2903669 RepID=UPI002E300C1F|nr:hypothetical protein [Streptomyces sp. NBC_00659]